LVGSSASARPASDLGADVIAAGREPLGGAARVLGGELAPALEIAVAIEKALDLVGERARG
jgi:hypothetical protein